MHESIINCRQQIFICDFPTQPEAGHSTSFFGAHLSLKKFEYIQHGNSSQPEKMCFKDYHVRHELFTVLKLTIPSIITYMIDYGYELITLIYVGQTLTTSHLDGLALGTVSCNLTGFSIQLGILSPMETLGSQASGSQDWKLLSLYDEFFSLFVSTPKKCTLNKYPPQTRTLLTRL